MRSLLAHGKVLPPRFLTELRLENAEGQPCLLEEGQPYFSILSDAGCAMLCSSIKKILLTPELRELFETQDEWEGYLSGG